MVDTDPLKKSRSSAKGQFTKAKNSLIRVRNSNSDIEIIETITPIFNQLVSLKSMITPSGIKKMKTGIKSHMRYR